MIRSSLRMILLSGSKMKAFISDIHANEDALQNVLNDIDQHNVDEIICLGDIVGYGPDPVSCTEQVMDCAKQTILGNHDHALTHGAIGFNDIAQEAIDFTREIMKCQGSEDETKILSRVCLTCLEKEESPRCFDMESSSKEHWGFLENLPTHKRDGDLLYVHGSPLDPTFEYVMPDVFSRFKPERVQDMFTEVDRLAFCGHTHYPCAVDSDIVFHYPQVHGSTVTLDPEKKYIINIGSVGQPRDRDNRSCYVLFDQTKRTVEWRRIEYDIQSVVDRISSMCGLDNWCGERLLLGR